MERYESYTYEYYFDAKYMILCLRNYIIPTPQNS